MMNRVFHLRISLHRYIFLFLVGAIAFFFLWQKQIIPAAAALVLLVVWIERAIHTTYTITPDNRLVVSLGRFAKVKSYTISEIVSVQTRHSVEIAGFALLRYVLIEYAPGKYTSVMPLKEEEFIHVLETKMKREK